MTIDPFKVYYEFKAFAEDYVDSVEEKNNQYQSLKQVFQDLITSSSEKQPKITFDDKERKILCGYENKKEFKLVFPKVKESIKIAGFIDSPNKGATFAIASVSSEYKDEFYTNREQIEKTKKEKKQQFLNEMEIFYKENTSSQRLHVDISNCSSTEELMRCFLKEHQGFGVGDDHSTLATLIFLTTHMALFKELRGTTLFWEGYPEHLEKSIKQYFDPSNPADNFPKKLQDAILITKDQLFKNYNPEDYSKPFNSYIQNIQFEFYKALKKNGIKLKQVEIRELCAPPASLDWSIEDDEESGNPWGAKHRIKPMNFCAQKILNAFKVEHPDEKFIYFDGYWHNSFYGKIKVPGISEITGCPWLASFDGKVNEELIVSGRSEKGKEILKKRGVYSPQFHQTIDPDAILVLHPDQSLTGKICTIKS